MHIPPPQGPWATPGQHQPGPPYAVPGAGPAPYPQGPGAWPGGYPQGPGGPPPYNNSTNGLAIAALVTGLLCFPPIGLILGIVALSQIRRSGERGKGLAITGIVISSLQLVVILAVFVAALADPDSLDDDSYDSPAPASSYDGGQESSLDLRLGQCFNADHGLEGMTYDVETVPCEGGHQAEVFAEIGLGGGSYPGAKALETRADEDCFRRLHGYAMDTWALPDDVTFYHYTPTERSWAAGDAGITCVFGHNDGTSELTGSLRNDEQRLNSAQVDYLTAEGGALNAWDSIPLTEEVEEDLQGHKEWAGRMSAAYAAQQRELRSGNWEGAAAAPVAREIAALGKARTHWDSAARSATADDFNDHWYAAEEVLTDAHRTASRQALGLDTTPWPPAGEGDSGGSGDSGGTGGGSGGPAGEV